MIGSLLRIPLALLVLFYQSLFLALGQIRTNKVRSLLTMVGIIIGVASVTAVGVKTGTGKRLLTRSPLTPLGTRPAFPGSTRSVNVSTSPPVAVSIFSNGVWPK